MEGGQVPSRGGLCVQPRNLGFGFLEDCPYTPDMDRNVKVT